MSILTMNNRRGRLLLAAVVILVAVAVVALQGCRPDEGAPVEPDEPQNPQALWEAQALESYRYTLHVSCFCVREMARPVVVEVRDGAVASITYADDGASADPSLFERYDTVDDLFDLIAVTEAKDPARLDVTYAEETGVPLEIDVDIREEIVDEELRVTVSDFEALE